jgi:hypothetical protein
MFDSHDAHAIRLRHLDALVDSEGRSDEAERVLCVQQRHNGRFQVELEIGVGIEYTVLDTLDVPAQSIDTVCVDTAEISEDERVRYQVCAI